MKKYILVVLLLVLYVPSPLIADEISKRTLIVFYSQSGKNKLIAEHIDSQIQNSDLKQIKLKEEIGFGSLIFKHIVRGDLEIEKIHVDEYDTIIISTPIWLQMLALPTKVFIESANFEGKEVCVFITCGGFYGFSESLEEWIAEQKADVKGLFVIKVGGKTDEEIKKEISIHLKNTELLH
ncbi:MAG: flavodoxin family protein [Planctomycetota bacterium]|jgi:flavodoxin